MDYIAVIDYEHLDNGIFLNAFAESLSRQSGKRGLIIHGESAYTERLIQTGIIREEATIRAVKDLNHRLIALLADHGISAIGLNGYQRSLLSKIEDRIHVDHKQLESLPKTPHLLLSSLVQNSDLNRPEIVPLQEAAGTLQKQLKIDEILLFNMDDSEEVIARSVPDRITSNDIGRTFPAERIPAEFRKPTFSFRLTSARNLSQFPSMKGSTLIKIDSLD